MWSIALLGNEIRYRVIFRLLSRRPAPAASQPRPYAVETDKPPKTHRSFLRPRSDERRRPHADEIPRRVDQREFTHPVAGIDRSLQPAASVRISGYADRMPGGVEGIGVICVDVATRR